MFNAVDVDVARFGGYTFLKASEAGGAEPLVMRDIDARFTSKFVAESNSMVQSLHDLADTTFAFGSRLSTSGYLMPRHFMLENGIDPEQHFSKVLFTGAHDETIRWVANGRVSVGVVNSVVLDRMIAMRDPAALSVRVLERTPPYANYVWAARKSLPQGARDAIVDAFLKLSDDKHAAILDDVSAAYYLPASARDFSSLRSTALRLGRLH